MRGSQAAAPQAASVREEDFSADGDAKATTRRAPRKAAAKKGDDAPVAAAEEAPAAE